MLHRHCKTCWTACIALVMLGADCSDRWQASSHRLNARVPCSHRRERAFTRPLHSIWSACGGSPEEPSCSRLDECFLTGHHQAPRQRLSPFFPEVHDELTISWHAPHSSCIHPSASAALTSAEEKEYERLPPVNESVAAHLCPPTAIGWKAKASHPSKLCICTRWTRLRLCFRSSRPRCSPVIKPFWMQLHSGTWGAWQTWPCASLKPPPKPLGVRGPAW